MSSLALTMSLRGQLLSGVSRDAYAVGNYKPELAFDFVGDYFRKNGTRVLFDSALTATRAGNATMVDSDGKIKWAPHNLIPYSEDFSAWFKTGVTVSVNTTAAPDGSISADTFTETSGGVVDHSLSANFTPIVGQSYRFGVYAKQASGTRYLAFRGFGAGGDYPIFDLIGSTIINAGTQWSNTSISPVGNGWYYCASTVVTLAAFPPYFHLHNGTTYTYAGDGTSGIYLWGAHLYQSSLGGMVDVPSDARAIPSATKYVPTTSAARYLPRRGHHVYNGSEWVNEGLLVESEARTNLFLNSGSLSTQSVTVTAVPHTLSFTGTGTITLTGVSTAGPLVGTGTGENNRVSLTFTPTAGVLLATVTGTVTNAQLEAGSTPSSYIPTAGATVTRAAETLVIPSANLPWPSPQYVTGTELVTNGTFDTDISGWTAASGGSLSVVGGALRVTEALIDGATGRAFQVIPTVVGKLYLLSVDLIATSHAFDVAVNTSSNFGGAIVADRGSNTPRTVRLPFVATATNTYIIFGVGVDTLGSYSDYDNISVKEINPLAVSIAMDGRMTYADINDDNTVLFLQWRKDGDNFFLPRLETSSTATGRVAFYQEALNVQDVRKTGDTAYSPGINVPFNIASRHGSTFVNGAVDGVALTADLTPVALPDLSATNLQLGYAFMGTIGSFRIWADDIGDAGLVTATNPSTEPSLLLTFDSAETSFVDLGWSE